MNKVEKEKQEYVITEKKLMDILAEVAAEPEFTGTKQDADKLRKAKAIVSNLSALSAMSGFSHCNVTYCEFDCNTDPHWSARITSTAGIIPIHATIECIRTATNLADLVTYVPLYSEEQGTTIPGVCINFIVYDLWEE